MTDQAGAAPDAIAVVGLSGRFPGAATVEAFWDNLRRGVESITVFTAEQLAAAGIPPAVSRSEGYVAAAGVLDGIDLFDARLFGFSPRDAELLDPQQRLFLECAWEALERAGCNPDEFPGLISVYAGTSLSLYAQHNLYPMTGIAGGLDDFQVFLGNDKDHIATRVAYKLNLRGPAVTVQTACSTSLVAICVACDSLQALQCDLAIAGGVTIRVPQVQGYVYKEGGIGSPDGHCRSFDAAAKGTVGSSGVAVVALKRLSDAIAGGDHIHAVVRGWALNNDGSSKVGYTAPSVAGQSEVVEAALAMAGLGPEHISYIEAHGTATPIGDPIEVAALARVFSRRVLPRRSCAIGSLKSAVGHLDSAAGAAGFIKTVLALEHQVIPPSLHFTSPNPEIDFDSGPFFVNDRPREWSADRVPRRAGVSSFGIGGTNAHVVVEEPPAAAAADPAEPVATFVLSAQTASALNALSEALAAHLVSVPDANISDVAATLQVGRKALAHRRAFVAHDPSDAVQCLRRRDPSRVRDRVVEGAARTLVFMFPGQGAQHVDMASGLYRTCGVFAEEFERGASELARTMDLDLRDAIFAAGRPGAESSLQSTAVAQPALFVVEYALARMWMRWGVGPSALIGHSLGEYVAATLAGVFSFEDALRLVALRGELMEQMPRGAMTAVPLSEAAVEPLLGDGLEIAAVNAPGLTLLSGPFERIERLEHELATRGVAVRRLKTSHAFHSAMMEPVLDRIADAAAKAAPKPPRLPIVSNLSGTWLTAEQATDPAYWARHAREPVRFAEGLHTLRRGGPRTLFEVGPGRTLTALARMSPQNASSETGLASLPLAEGTSAVQEHLAETLGALWLDGHRVDWRATHGSARRRRVTLPTYPFERQRYWIEPRGKRQRHEPSPVERQDVEHWFSVPSWMRKAPAGSADTAALRGSTWLILSDREGVGAAVAQRLQDHGARVRLVVDGDGPAVMHAAATRVHDREYYGDLLADLDETGDSPPRLVHCWSLTGAASEPPPERALLGGMYSLMALAQAAIARYPGRSVRIDVVTDAVHRVLGNETLVPLKRALVAVAKGVPQEYPHVICRVVELDCHGGNGVPDRRAELAMAELQEPATLRQVAYRGAHRWVPAFERILLPGSATGSRLRREGVYVITGGLGQIGLTLAAHLASQYHAKLTLMGRTALPDRSEWERIAADGNGDAAAARVRAVRAIEAAGGEVLVIQGDAANPDDVRGALEAARATFGAVHGIIHGAGLTSADGFAPAADVDVALCERQLAGKVGGALAIAELVRAQPIDFVMLLSSLSSVLVGLGFIPYAAANLVLDALAEREDARGATPWISVGWDGWDFSADGASGTDLVITPSDGVLAFERVIAAAHGPNIVVSTADLDARIREWIDLAGARQNQEDQESNAGERHARPDISSEFIEPATGTERAIAAIWQSLLGLQRVGLNDNFFELGGHSLLAIQLTARIREQFHVDVPVRTLFDAPTIAALAAFVDAGHARADAETARIVRVLDEVERLSDEEMQALLAAQPRSTEASQ